MRSTERTVGGPKKDVSSGMNPVLPPRDDVPLPDRTPSLYEPTPLDTIRGVVASMESKRKLSPDVRDTLVTFQLWRYFPSTEKVAVMLHEDEEVVQSRIDTVYKEPLFDAFITEFDRTAEAASVKHPFDELFDEALEGVEQILTPREYEFFTLANQGLTNRQIADRTFVEPGTVRYRLMSTRKKIETQRLHPRGIKELTSYKKSKTDETEPDVLDYRLLGAASRGQLKTRLFLRQRYISDALVEDFFRRRAPDPEWLGQGRIPLYEHVSRTERRTFANKRYESFLFKHPETGLIYTTHENLAIMRSMRRPRTVDPKWLAQDRILLYGNVTLVEWNSFSRRKQYEPYIWRHPDSGLIYTTSDNLATMRRMRKPRPRVEKKTQEQDIFP